jgi:NADPH2:quinone reductase
MKAVVIKAFGGPEVFEPREVPIPVPSPKQVLVRVVATSVNPLDYQIRRGDYKAYVKLPAIIGSDVSGIIEAVGDAVTDFKVGDEVYYTPQIFNGDGSYAEYHLADESIVAHKPKNLSHFEAASLTLTGGTAWEALVTRGSCKRVNLSSFTLARAVSAPSPFNWRKLSERMFSLLVISAMPTSSGG